MAYEITTTDGQVLIVIQDGSVNSTPALTIGLVGRNTLNYGEPWAETFVHMLEHFASYDVKPINPIPGQIWYNKLDKNLYINTSDTIHNYDSWEKIAIEARLGNIDNPIDNIFVGSITSDDFNGGDFTGEVFTGTNFNGGTFTGSFVGNLQGNAATASKWATPRQIVLNGDVTGEMLLDGSANVSMTTTVLDDSHNHIIANVDGLQSALNGLAPIGHIHAGTIISAIQLTATDNLDNFKSPGFFYQTSSANASTSRGYPEASAGALMVMLANGPVQQYHVYNSSKIYYRGQTGAGAWTEWAEQYNTLNKPTTGDVGAQPLDATLTALAGLSTAADRLPYFIGTDAAALTTLTTFARTLLDDGDAATMRSTISAQQSDATLTALAGLATAADRLPYFTGTDTANVTTLTSFARTLLDDGDAGTMRGTIGASPLGHTHPISDVSGLQNALNGKSDTGHTHSPGSIGAAPAAHSHFTSMTALSIAFGTTYTNTSGQTMFISVTSHHGGDDDQIDCYVNGNLISFVSIAMSGEDSDGTDFCQGFMVPNGSTWRISQSNGTETYIEKIWSWQ